MAITFNSDLVHQVVRVKMLNKRRPIASTKDRAQVAGGGKKPWPQKGTGRARAGSNRSPLWKGGGITFGPNAKRSYAGTVTVKMSRLALAMVIAKKRQDREVIICESMEVKEAKTKQFSAWLRSLVNKGSALVVASQNAPLLKRAGRNLPGVKVTDDKNLDILDVLQYKYLVITKTGLKNIEQRLESNSKFKIKNL